MKLNVIEHAFYKENILSYSNIKKQIETIGDILTTISRI